MVVLKESGVKKEQCSVARILHEKKIQFSDPKTSMSMVNGVLKPAAQRGILYTAEMRL